MKTIYKFKPSQAEYAPDFLQLADPPEHIYMRGETSIFQRYVKAGRPVVGVVGTRRVDPTGRRLAREVGRILGQADCLVVSGLALGVDAEAHQGALAGGGKTVAVLGSGLEDKVITPQQHLGLAHEILRHGGALLSEYPATYPAGKYTYPARNRLIAALVSHLVVVQAPQHSGALITVDHALSLGKSISAFPGPALNPGWKGTNQLIKDGAEVLCEPEDVLPWLGLDVQAHLPLSHTTSSLLQLLQKRPCTKQELVIELRQPASEIAAQLTQAELAGTIMNLNGKWCAVHKKI